MEHCIPSREILKVICHRNALRLRGPEEVLHDGIGVVAKGHLDGAFEAMKVAVVACPLVRLVLLHQGNELLGGPALGLEVIIIGGRGSRVHLSFRHTRYD